MIVWVGKPLVLAIHQRQIAEHGGGPGVRDESLLDSALARPQQLHAYGSPAPDLAALAASLGHGLVRNHAFVDGNKRTGAMACEFFLEINEHRLVASDEDFTELVLATARGELSQEALAIWIRQRLRAA